MSELPSGWVETTIGEVLQFNYGNGLPERDRSGSGFPVYGSNGVVGYHEKALVSAESLVVGRKGSVGEIHHSRGPCWPIDTTYFVDEFSGMPARFWYYALKGLNLGGLNRATAIPGLNREDAYQVDVVLPPQTEQKRIADKLDAVLARVDACRERLDRVPAILKRFRQAVLAAATSGKLTEEWCEEHGSTWLNMPFEDLLAKEDGAIRRGPFGSSIKKSFFVNDGYKVYEQKNAIQDDANLGDYFINEAKFKELEGFSVRGGDFIVSCAGTIGRISQLPVGAKPGVINQALMRIRLDDTVVEASYFLLLFRSPEFQAQILEQTQGSAMQNMAAIKVIRQILIRVPSLEEQHEIVRHVEALFAYADRVESRYIAARAQVERLTPVLLAKAFHGGLVPQDPNDEPASVLLERIHAARAAIGETVGPKRRKGGGRSKTSQKSEVLMLTRKDVQDTHLTTILKERGPLTAEVLWSASQLDIDDFYDQLKDEESHGLLREKRGDSSNVPRMLEAA